MHEFATGGGARLVPSQLTDQGPASWVMPAAARPRLSGCPVFDRAWRLVGLHQFTDAVLGADLCLPVPWIGVSQRMEPINGQAPR